jgi:hypothetical protein
MKKLILLFLPTLFLSLSCTSNFTVKNKALVLSAEKFDKAMEARAKENFVDLQEQTIYMEFLKKNSRIDIKNFDVKSDTEATGDLVVQTVPKPMDAELKKVSGKDWQAMVSAKLETKTYPITMKKIKDLWEIQDLPF